MDIQEILQALEHIEEGHKFPREALQEAMEQQEAITPELFEILQWCNGNLQYIYDDPNYIAHTYAMFLLAQFRAKQAYPLIIEFFSNPDERVKEVSGDLVTEDLHRILASVWDGKIDPIHALIENEAINEYIRGAGLKALVTLALWDELPREEVLAYFQSLFREKLERTFSNAWNNLVNLSCDLYPEEVYDDIRQAYADDLVDPFYIRLEDVENYLKKGKNAVLERKRKSLHYSRITNTIEEMETWACFQTPVQQKKHDKALGRVLDSQIKKAAKRMANPDAPLYEPESSQPLRRTTPKVGRNDPCPCGSGKKYKKCCLNK